MAVKIDTWTKRIMKAEKFLERAHTHGKKVYQRYEDKQEERVVGELRANLFYANVNTLKESLFNSLPKPDIRQLHEGNYGDNVARVSCLVASRALDYEVHCAPSFKEAITSAILDRLVPGIGQVWYGFTAETDEAGNVIPGTEKVTAQNVHWCDFIYEPAKAWSKVGWVGRIHHMDTADFTDQYGEEALQKVGAPPKDGERGGFDPENVNKDKICVYEIWDKKDRMVYFMTKGGTEYLKVVEDPYELADFFPCPRPLIANVTTNAFLPVTDYHICQDQYLQLDKLYARISLIIDAVKVAGVYDAQAGQIVTRMLTEGQNQLIPVENWAMMMEKGGVKGMIDWYPVEQVATVLANLQTQYEALKGLLAEISGMSDIVRGDTNQYETAKAQQIKAQFASVRLGGYQRDTAEFVRDGLRIMADLAFGLYSDDKMLQIIGPLEEPDMQYLEAAAGVLRDDFTRKYKVDIETDSLTQADWALEKTQRQEIIQVVGSMIGQMVPMIKEVPQMAPLAAQMLKFAISGYKGAQEITGWLNQQVDQMARSAMEAQQNPQPPQPSPEELKVQAEMQKNQQEAEIKQQQAQNDMAMEQQRLQFEREKNEMELAHKQAIFEMDMRMKQMELGMRQKNAMLDLSVNAAKSTQQLEVDQQRNEMDLENNAAKNEQALKATDAKNQQALKQAKAQPKKPNKGE